MSLPSTQKQWKIQEIVKDSFDGLVYEDVPIPKIGDSDVLVKMQGASLNYRDLIIPQVLNFLIHHLVMLGADLSSPTKGQIHLWQEAARRRRLRRCRHHHRSRLGRDQVEARRQDRDPF